MKPKVSIHGLLSDRIALISQDVLHEVWCRANQAWHMAHIAEQEEVNTVEHETGWLAAMQRLALAPISKSRRVLDVGSGHGHWAIDFGVTFYYPNSIPG